MTRLIDKNVSNETKELVLNMADADIKYNRIWYNKITTLAETKRIINSCLLAAERVQHDGSHMPSL